MPSKEERERMYQNVKDWLAKTGGTIPKTKFEEELDDAIRRDFTGSAFHFNHGPTSKPIDPTNLKDHGKVSNEYGESSAASGASFCCRCETFQPHPFARNMAAFDGLKFFICAKCSGRLVHVSATK